MTMEIRINDKPTLYKFLNEDGTSTIQGAKWPLPTGRRGRWQPRLSGELVLCERGYHLCRTTDLVHWLGPVLYSVPGDCYEDEGMIVGDDKVAVRRARLAYRVEEWNEMNARLFAADCAEAVLHKWESLYPQDDRPRAAIAAARAFAREEISAADLSAARSAAESAAEPAAESAARSAQSALLAERLGL